MQFAAVCLKLLKYLSGSIIEFLFLVLIQMFPSLSNFSTHVSPAHTWLTLHYFFHLMFHKSCIPRSRAFHYLLSCLLLWGLVLFFVQSNRMIWPSLFKKVVFAGLDLFRTTDRTVASMRSIQARRHLALSWDPSHIQGKMSS